MKNCKKCKWFDAEDEEIEEKNNKIKRCKMGAPPWAGGTGYGYMTEALAADFGAVCDCYDEKTPEAK